MLNQNNRVCKEGATSAVDIAGGMLMWLVLQRLMDAIGMVAAAKAINGGTVVVVEAVTEYGGGGGSSIDRGKEQGLSQMVAETTPFIPVASHFMLKKWFFAADSSNTKNKQIKKNKKKKKYITFNLQAYWKKMCFQSTSKLVFGLARKQRCCNKNNYHIDLIRDSEKPWVHIEKKK